MAEKKYFRQVGSGNISIEGTDANGMTLTNGNTYIYSGDTPSLIDNLPTNDPNKKVQPADPNNTSSYIAVTKTGVVDVNVGNANQQSLNVQNNSSVVTINNTPQKPGKAIIIGDSQTESIKANSKLLEPIGPQGVLWKVGWNLKNLNEAIKKYDGDEEVVKVFINIGTNDGYQETTSIKDFIDVVKEKFPNAANGLYVFGGSYGWGNLKNTKIDTLTPYYKKFTDVGVFKLKNDIGYSANHPNDKTPGIVAVGKEIDEIISSTLVPTVVKQQTQKPTVERTKVKGSTRIEVEEDTLYSDDLENLPDEEQPAQLYQIIDVRNNIQEKVPDTPSPSLVSLNSLKVVNDVVRKAGGVVPKEGTDFNAYGSQFKLVQNDGTLGSQYYYPCALFNQGDPQWGSFKGGGYTLKSAGCCYCSFAMASTYHKNNAGYTPSWYWDNAKKSTVVYWGEMADAVKLVGNLSTATKISQIDEKIKNKPVIFEWDNTNKASSTNYSGRYTKNHHWMVITGKNTDGTYTIFDPNGGKIWKNQTKEAIEAGLIRIFYFN